MLWESLLSIKQTKIMRYPKQISLSREFLEALKKEVEGNLIIDESKEEPIKNFREKFIKALHFHITDLQEHCGHCHKKPVQKKKKKKGPVVQGQVALEYGTSQVTGDI
jgi:16S rRNA G1207 methylase RsmC